MKNINNYIFEKLVINKNTNCIHYNYHPKDKEELKQILKERVKKDKNANLNDIDVSKITDMSYLFNYKELIDFDGDISEWDVSNVTNMYLMFSVSKYSGKNGGISNWDVRNVENFDLMFDWAKYFNGNLNNWKVNKNASMKNMFANCPLEKNPPKWYSE